MNSLFGVTAVPEVVATSISDNIPRPRSFTAVDENMQIAKKKAVNEDELDQTLSELISSAQLELERARKIRADHPESIPAQARYAQAALVMDLDDDASAAARQVFDLAYRYARESTHFDAGQYQIHLQSCALILIGAGRQDEALRLLLEFPSLDTLRVLAAGILVEQGKNDAAIELTRDLKTPDAAVLQAFVSYDAGDFSRSIHACRTALEQDPDDVYALALLAGSYLSLGSRTKAIRYAAQAKAVAPHLKDIRAFYVSFLIMHGQFDAARNELRAIREEGAVPWAGYYVLCAQAEGGLGNHSRALQMLRDARDELDKPDAGLPHPAAKVQIDANIAMLSGFLGRISESEVTTSLRAAWKESESDAYCGLLLIRHLNYVSDADEANAIVSNIRRAHADNPVLPELEAWAAYLSTDFKAALGHASNWLAKSPKSRVAASMIADLVGNLSNDWAKAAAILRSPSLAGEMNATYANELAYALALSGQASDAYQLIKRWTDGSYVLTATEGLALIALGEVDDGLRMYRRAAEKADKEDTTGEGAVLMAIHQAMALRHLGLDVVADKAIQAGALVSRDLDDAAWNRPEVRLLFERARNNNWPWPVVID